jgi:hypothetical protein
MPLRSKPELTAWRRRPSHLGFPCGGRCDGMHTQYFDKFDYRCHDCDTAAAEATVVTCSVVAFLLVIAGLVAAIIRGVAFRSHRAGFLRQFGSFNKLWQEAGMRYKVKTLLGLYQCIGAVPSVFNVDVPPGLEHYTRCEASLDMFHRSIELKYAMSLLV